MATLLRPTRQGLVPLDMIATTRHGAPAQVMAPPSPPARRDPDYLLGRSEREARRLTVQAELYEPATRRILVRAGLRPGMRVLDIGSGAGDVAMLAAHLVGPAGSVVGIDANPAILGLARSRADAERLDNVEFFPADMRDLPPLGPFDAVIGRLVLMYVAEPVTAVRSLARHLRPGGIMAFAEFNVAGDAVAFWPRLPLWERVLRWMQDIPATTGVEFAMGWKLAGTLAAAGLGAAELSLESPLLPARGGTAAFYVAETVRSAMPLIVKCGIATAMEIDIETLEARLQAEALTVDAVIKLPELVGATVRT